MTSASPAAVAARPSDVDAFRASLARSAQGYGRFGIIVMFAVLFGLGGWSGVAQIEGAVIAPATIEVEANRQAVQHLEGGIVREIAVREGDHVEAGDLVLRLDETVAKATQDVLGARLVELLGTQARLAAERDGAETVSFPEEMRSLGGEAQGEEIMAAQTTLFEARRRTLTSETDLLRQRVVQLDERIIGLQALQTARERQLELTERELAGIQQLFEQGHAPETRVLALQREVERLRGEQGEHAASIAEARATITESSMEVVRREATFREEVLSELRTAEAQIAELRERRVAAADALSRTEIRAPRSGRVLGLRSHTIGGVMRPGDTVMEIVPDDDALLVVARIRPQDVDRVAAGDPARLRFSVNAGRMTPDLDGEVVQVSADALTDQASGARYYEARIRFSDAASLDTLGFDIVPGMPIEAFVRTGSRRAIEYVIEPLTDAVSRSLRED